MGLHPSLKRAEKLGRTRSVMKRLERIKWLIAKGLWKEGDRIHGLPKIKVVKIKAAKKEKKEEEKPEEAAAAAPEEAATPKKEEKKA
ncbi:MAG: small basic protein [Candidatus Omnitrophota bacterium]|nr:MAG: small basic protein [Candidatus Omnitrophota bacterium]